MAILITFLNDNYAGGRMKWFKHYSNASQSNKLAQIKASLGHAGYGRYWNLLELMSEKFGGDQDDIFMFSTRDLRNILGYYRTNDLLMYLQCLADVGLMSFESNDQVTSISSPILSELQSRDFKKARSERGQSAVKNKIKNKIKNKSKDKEEELRSREILSLWNEGCSKLPQIKKLTSGRLRKSKVLFENHTKEEITEAISRLAASDFCNGKNDRAWVANIDFFLKPDSIPKILEGQYDNRAKSKTLSKLDQQYSDIADYVATLEDK